MDHDSISIEVDDLSTFTHDVNNHLANITLLAQVLKNRLEPQDHEKVEQILGQVKRVEVLVREMRDRAP